MSDPDDLERLKAERLRAERQARQAVERERLAIQHAEERAAFEKAEAESVAVEEMWPAFEGEIIGIWTAQPKPSRNVANRLWDLCAAVKEIIAMEGQPDWRGLLVEALEDATA
jgi:hypothetical protein